MVSGFFFGGFPITAQSGFPGQPGNPVGYAATPATQPSVWNGGTWPGAYSSLTTVNGTAPPGGLVSGTPGNPTIYSFYDFVMGTGGFDINNTYHDITFVGCRFQSNSTQNYNIQSDGTNILFSYCSVVPLVSLVGTQPPLGGGYSLWPSGGAGSGFAGGNSSTYSISGDNAYQYGFNIGENGGSFKSDHCDVWGAGNGIIVYGTGGTTITDMWLHDAPNQGSQGYHIDGIAYPNNQIPPSNVTITHCTIASIANTQGIGFQGGGNATSTGSTIAGTVLTVGGTLNLSANSFDVGMVLVGAGITPNSIILSRGTGTGGAGTYNLSQSSTISTPQSITGTFSTYNYNNMTITNNYLSGFSSLIDNGYGPVLYSAATNWNFSGNTIGTDLLYAIALVYDDESVQFTHTSNPTNTWSNNKLLIANGGTTNYSGSTPSFTSGSNGYYLWPDNTLHATDWPN